METDVVVHDDLLKVIENESAVLVYFYNNSCAPCVSLRPKVGELVKNKFPLMKFITIDAEKNQSLAAQYNIFASPTLIVFLEGREYRRESKYISIPQLQETIQRPYAMIFE